MKMVEDLETAEQMHTFLLKGKASGLYKCIQIYKNTFPGKVSIMMCSSDKNSWGLKRSMVYNIVYKGHNGKYVDDKMHEEPLDISVHRIFSL